jgi:hypothetical protein
VQFITPDGKERMRYVNENGRLGEVLDFEDMYCVLDKLAKTSPVDQQNH